MNGAEATAGVPFRVEHWLPHSVENTSDRARIHIVIDRAVLVDNRHIPFQRIEEQA
jgi:hypothetical protein